jgi:hypothetical protein
VGKAGKLQKATCKRFEGLDRREKQNEAATEGERRKRTGRG